METKRTGLEHERRKYTQQLRAMLIAAAVQARDQVSKATDPRAQALLETTAEVLHGLITACRHFEEGQEPAWRDGGDSPPASAHMSWGTPLPLQK